MYMYWLNFSFEPISAEVNILENVIIEPHIN